MAAPLTFGRYEALFHIASGGMAEVFAARLRGPHGFQKLVAVKRLLPDLIDPQFVSMFMDEAKVAASISSPNVVQTMELGRDSEDGALYIVMELVTGVTLFDLCVSILEQKQRIPVAEIAEILAQAARGLDDAHEARSPQGQRLDVVHRDVSPQNILIGLDGRVRVTDFGIARAANRNTETRAGQVKGKVAYLSPEQATGKNLDKRSDVFSLGIVGWECLTGCSLFNNGDQLETISRVRDLKIPPVVKLRPDVPPEISNAIAWALERERDKRCPSAAEFGRTLRNTGVCASPRDVGALVERFGGKRLAEMQERIRSVSDLSVVFRPEFATESSRILPEVVPAPKVLPASIPPTSAEDLATTKRPARDDASENRIAQRDVATTPLPNDAIVLTHMPPPAQPRRQTWLWGFGAIAWILAGVLLWWGLELSAPKSAEPILRVPVSGADTLATQTRQ